MLRGGRLLVGMCWVLACSKDVQDGAGFASGGSPPGDSATSSGAGENTSVATGVGDSGESQSADSADATSEGMTSDGVTSGEDSSSTGDGTTSDGGDSPGTSSSSGVATTSDSMGGSALDPDLDVPPDGEACDTPGYKSDCPGFAYCRFYDSEEGRCESCDPCGNLGAFCDSSDQCDVLFSCFRGVCTNFCTLGQSECGPVEDCLDIGHPTRGVCDPAGI